MELFIIFSNIYSEGGGLLDNIPRILPKNICAHLDANKWLIPPVFAWLAQNGNVKIEEMLRTFNCGVGFTLITSPADGPTVLECLQDSGETAWVIGKLNERSEHEEPVKVDNFKDALNTVMNDEYAKCSKRPRIVNGGKVRLRVGVLISGSGTNLQALIDQSLSAKSNAKIALVISNVPGVRGLERATAAGIKSKVFIYSIYYQHHLLAYYI